MSWGKKDSGHTSLLSPCWGDTGRLPIAVTCIKQAFNYIKRLESLKHGHHETLAGNALKEQENLSLPWFKRELQEQLGMNRSLDAAKALSNIESKFKRLWTSAMPLNSKLRFYNIVKSEITFEPYLTFLQSTNIKEDELLHNWDPATIA